MRKGLKRLLQCSRHLRALDTFFANRVPEYRRQERKLQNMGRHYDEFAQQLYAGGRKEGRLDLGGRYHRGMMLADLLTYAVFCRGAFIATASREHRTAFVEIVLRIVNKLLLQENISTDVKLRRGLLAALSSMRLRYFYEDVEQRSKFDELRKYDGPIVWGLEGTEHYKTMDALLPKSRGLAIEFLIYLYLLHRKFGYVVPLLLHQRLLTTDSGIAPPDFLLIKSDGRCFAIEVGFSKEGQSTEFVTKTSLPTVAAELDNDQPFRCSACGKWITYCDRVVEDYSKGISSPDPLPCAKCSRFRDRTCADIIFHGKEPGAKSPRRYHYHCVSGKPWIKTLETKGTLDSYLRVWYPTASMIDSLSEGA